MGLKQTTQRTEDLNIIEESIESKKEPIQFTAKWDIVQLNGGDELTKRYSHSACVIGDFVYYFAGVHTDYKNDMYKFDLYNNYWQLLECKGDIPSKRASFASCVRKGNMYIYGGYNGTYYMNDLYEFNPSTNTWIKIIPRGSYIPRVIGCQTTAIYDDKMWSFGGYHPDEGITDDFNCFDFSTNTWSVVNCPKLPKKRSQHVSFIYNDSLIIVGGFYHDHYIEVDAFNFFTKQWNEISCSGDIPKRTSKLGAAIHGDNIFIFGGQSDHVNNDMYVLNLPRKMWVKVQMEGTVPTPRQWHFLFVWNDNLYVTCGCNGSRATTTELYKMELPKIRKKPDKLLVALYHQSFADVNFEYNSLL